MKFPDQPGVYLFKDKSGKVIYVGKAKSLKDRVSSYFKKPVDSPKTEALVSEYKVVDFIVTPTELEALLLERKLINKHKPRFNIMWRDDKQYPYIKITIDEEWPRLLMVRKKEKDGARYFGPYESRSVKDTIRLIKKLFPIRWCKESPLKFRQQPCLQYHLKNCLGPCVNGIKKEEYQNYVNAMIKVLDGDLSSAVRYLQEEMDRASKEQKFEQAARVRDRIRNLSRLLQKRPEWAPKVKEKAGDTSAWELKNALGLRKSPQHIEAFDISNIQRENLVASMVTFRNGEPEKSDYRKFKIKGFTLPNDVAAINQVVSRRYTGALKDKMEQPDLILIDGGIAQVRAAKKALDGAGIKVPVIGLAKQNEEIFFPEKNAPLKLSKESAALLLLMRIRDEAHRFAIAFHRASRRLLPPALALIFLLSLFSFSFSEVVLDEQQKLKQIQEQLEAQKIKLVETKKKEQESLSKLVTIKVELKKTTRDLNKAKTKIVENVGEIKQLSSQIDEAKETLSQKTEKLKKRVREVYKSSAVNYLDLMFSTKSMSDFINRAYFFGRIIDGDAKLITDITDQYHLFRTQKTKLVVVTEEIKGLAKEIGQKREEIATKAEEEKGVLDDLKERREDYEKKIAELEKSSEELTRIIQAKMAQRKKAGIYAKGSGAVDWPLRGRITSVFGYRRDPFWRGRHMHTGVDIAAPYGEVIRAADSGQVIFSGWWDGYGKAVVIDHGKNMSTVYGHMSRIYVQADNTVSKGQIIGLVGSTGYSTGPHLHFEVRINGKPMNPMKYLP